jgi:hypothetical protein
MVPKPPSCGEQCITGEDMKQWGGKASAAGELSSCKFVEHSPRRIFGAGTAPTRSLCPYSAPLSSLYETSIEAEKREVIHSG